MSERTPAAVAAGDGFWSLSIRDLDRIIDQLRRRAETFAASKYTGEAWQLREAEESVRAVRDRLLVNQYDTNRTPRNP